MLVQDIVLSTMKNEVNGTLSSCSPFWQIVKELHQSGRRGTGLGAPAGPPCLDGGREDRKPRSAENASEDTSCCNADYGGSRKRRPKGWLESEKAGLGSMTLEFCFVLFFFYHNKLEES